MANNHTFVIGTKSKPWIAYFTGRSAVTTHTFINSTIIFAQLIILSQFVSSIARKAGLFVPANATILYGTTFIAVPTNDLVAIYACFAGCF